jgi:hypothetical protein
MIMDLQVRPWKVGFPVDARIVGSDRRIRVALEPVKDSIVLATGPEGTVLIIDGVEQRQTSEEILKLKIENRATVLLRPSMPARELPFFLSNGLPSGTLWNERNVRLRFFHQSFLLPYVKWLRSEQLREWGSTSIDVEVGDGGRLRPLDERVDMVEFTRLVSRGIKLSTALVLDGRVVPGLAVVGPVSADNECVSTIYWWRGGPSLKLGTELFFPLGLRDASDKNLKLATIVSLE